MTESQGCWKLDMRVFIEVHLGIARWTYCRWSRSLTVIKKDSIGL